MNELIVEGIEIEDFLLIKKILETYKVSINSEISFKEVQNLYNKIIDIVTYLEDK